MQKLLGTFCFLTIFFTGFAQVKKTYKAKPGEKVIENLPVEIQFQHPQFVRGTVNFANNKASTTLLNYNRILDEIQFINNQGDTLSLAEEPAVASIFIASDTFYFSEGYVKKFADVKEVKFGEKTLMVVTTQQKLKGMGQLSPGSIYTYDRISTSQGMRDLGQKEQLIFVPSTTFYITDKLNHFIILNKSSLLNVYEKQEHEVQEFLKQQQINFQKVDDVTKLIGYLGSI